MGVIFVLLISTQVSFTVNEVDVEEMTLLCHTSKAETLCRKICARLQEAVPRQQFRVQIRGQVNGSHVCSEIVKPFRKDVTQKLVSASQNNTFQILSIQTWEILNYGLIMNTESNAMNFH